MKHQLRMGHPRLWVAGIFMLFFLGGMGVPVWGQLTLSPSMTSYCLDGSNLTITIPLNGETFDNLVSVTLGGAAVNPNTTAQNIFQIVLNSSTLQCGTNLSLAVIYRSHPGNSSPNTHTITTSVNITCQPAVTYPNQPYCNLPGNQYLPTTNNLDSLCLYIPSYSYKLTLQGYMMVQKSFLCTQLSG